MIGNSSSIPLQRTASAWIILLLLSRNTSMGVAPTAIVSASVSCLSSSLLSVKNPQSHEITVFCDDPCLPQPLHNNDTKIGTGSDQSCEPQLQMSRVSRLWSGSHTSRLPQLIWVVFVVRVIEATDVLKIVCSVLRSYWLMPGRLKGSHPMVIAPLSLASTFALFLALIS